MDFMWSAHTVTNSTNSRRQWKWLFLVAEADTHEAVVFALIETIIGGLCFAPLMVIITRHRLTQPSQRMLPLVFGPRPERQELLCCVRHSFSASSQRGMWLSGGRHSGSGCASFGLTNNLSSKMSESVVSAVNQDAGGCSQPVLLICKPDHSHLCKMCCSRFTESQTSESVSTFWFNQTRWERFSPSFQTWAEKE